MTDRDLVDAAWKQLTLTTDPYPTWKKKGFPATSHWAKAKTLLDQVDVAPPPPPSGDVHTVPASIDNTGLQDVTAALSQWIKTVPDGSTLRFNGVYRIHSMLDITGRKGLTFDGAASTLKWTTPVTLSGSDYVGNDGLRLLRFGDCADITLIGFNLVGASPMTSAGDGFKAWEANVQHMHTLAVSRCTNLVIDRCTIDGSGGGDGINWGNENQGVRSTGVIRDTVIRNAHRCGIALVGSGGLTITNTRIERIGAWPIDLEPNTVESGNYNTVLDNVTFGPQSGLVTRPTVLAFAGSKDGKGQCDGLTIRNCKAAGRAFEIRLNTHDYGGYPYPYPLRIKNVRIENNTSDTGGVAEICQVDGLDASGNSFPVATRDCTNARVTP